MRRLPQPGDTADDTLGLVRAALNTVGDVVEDIDLSGFGFDWRYGGGTGMRGLTADVNAPGR